MSKQGNIIIKKARVHNLKDVDVEIPRGKLVVITGLSGSGKSSLAFDTLYAEGQRRYVESLSSYARQFLGRMSKPEVDYIKGIPPAIAIEQRVNIRNPRSTVGTSTEIYEYLKLLYARVGKTYSPISGEIVKKQEVEDVVDKALSYPEGTKLAVLAPVTLSDNKTMTEQLKTLQQQGFSRVEIDGKTCRIEEITEEMKKKSSSVFLMIDRLTVDNDQQTVSRLTDSVETAFSEGNSSCILQVYEGKEAHIFRFSKNFEADGMAFETPSIHLFGFNNPLGACPVCEGFGKTIGIDEHLVIPNKQLSVYEGAVVPWRSEGMSEWKNRFIRMADEFNFPIHKPICKLTETEYRLLWKGNGCLEGIDAFFKFLEEHQYKIQYRVMLARYKGKTVCPSCGGSRLKKEAEYVKIAGKSIGELVLTPIDRLRDFFDAVRLDQQDLAVAKRLLIEIKNRLHFLTNVGLGYLTLNRLSSTLSGGESQRINLVTSLGSSLVGSLYILDEPSIGLHARDTHLLIGILKQLRDLGNTVVVVEHDEEIMRSADYLIDIGPEAGRLGGEIVFQGTIDASEKPSPKALSPATEKSYTLKYLLGSETIPVPATRRKWNNYIEITGACENNLKNIDVKFPLNVMTVVTGVSGSGKSSLVRNLFYPALKKYYGLSVDYIGRFDALKGSMNLVVGVEFVDQNPIGKSSRSNPVTYIKAYDEIRKLFADQQLSKQLGYSPAFFSFNTDGGRCEECCGEGTITVEMQFMADLTLECEHCRGKRFKPDILEVTYRGANIFDVLEMTVNQAIAFFSEKKGATEKRIIKRLKPLQDVGIGYVKLGQSSSTLSGGESQRVKLASILTHDKPEPTIFIFDEPTTGLHFHDIKTLLRAFDALLEKGHTVVIIEHNPEVIKCADHLIDVGPEGGETGGQLVFAGTPEELIKSTKSHTARFLADKIKGT
ncbi:MAG: excinuclease ABC subunit UvrA [Prevotellaceae bacterium]|jgi:excinuclease ABC subunit A|nr:excinuclease ABC subunit UvrA [Prevotellaceae bacterium]